MARPGGRGGRAGRGCGSSPGGHRPAHKAQAMLGFAEMHWLHFATFQVKGSASEIALNVLTVRRLRGGDEPDRTPRCSTAESKKFRQGHMQGLAGMCGDLREAP